MVLLAYTLQLFGGFPADTIVFDLNYDMIFIMR